MAKGGARPNAGRKPGIKNKMQARAVEEAKKVGMLPHEFLLAVARGEVELLDVKTIDGEPIEFHRKPRAAERIAAATAAAPYYAPRLQNVQMDAKVSLADLSDAALDQQIARDAEHLGVHIGGGSVH